MTEDREKQIKMAEIAVRRGYANRLPMLIVKNMVEAFGEKAWEPLEKAAKEFAEYRVPMMKFLVDDPESARSLGNIFDFEDNLGGVEGEWKVTGPKKAVKIEKTCLPCEVFKEYPDYCGRLLYAVAKETIKLINPKADLTPFTEGKCLAYGDDCCEVVVQITD